MHLWAEIGHHVLLLLSIQSFMTLEKLLTISIASKDRPEVVEATLRKIHEFGLEDCPLILCDDGSSPQLAPPALSLFTRGRVLRNPVAQGQAAARNRIATECSTPYLLQLDDDSYPVCGSLDEALAIIKEHDNCAALALALDEPPRGRRTGMPHEGNSEPIRAFVGCGCILRVKFFLEIGGYAEWLGATGEEDEFCIQLNRVGKSVLYTDRLRVRHDVSHVGRDEEAIRFRSYRNWSWIWVRYLPCSVLGVLLFGLWLRAIGQILRGKGLAALRGCIEGLQPPSPRRKRESVTLAQYLSFRSKPHHLDMFEKVSMGEFADLHVPDIAPVVFPAGPPLLVSVIVPVFNRPDKIQECVNSVYQQTHRPIELLVVDDGSTDGTPAVLDEMERQWGGIADAGFEFRVIRQPNAGAPAARNRGLRHARGQWIQFLDSDDLLLPRKITNGLLEARRSNAVIVYCRAQFVDRSGVLLERFWGRPLSGDWRDYFEFSWQTMCALYSRQALESIGFWNEDLIISQDWEFCIRAVISGQSVEYHDEVGALYMSEGDDRIGSSLNSRKHRGRELALWSVHAYLENRGLMCSKIRGRFRSRFLHILISYRVCGESVLAANLLEQMAVANVLPGRLVGILGVVPNRWLAGFIVGRFDRLQASARSSIR